MLYNYLITTLYYLRKHLVFSFIKIFSLTLGLSCALLVIMHVQYIYSYDRHFPDWENIYRVVTSTTRDYNMTPDAYAAALAQDYSQIEHITRLRPAEGQFRPVTAASTESSPNAFFWVDPAIVDVFSLEFVSGDAATALSQANAIVLSETAARKYFGNVNPLGQALSLNNRNDLQVTGVMRDLPVNTYLEIEAMIPVETAKQINGENYMNSSGWISFGGTQTFFKSTSQADAESIGNDLDSFLERNVPDAGRAYAAQVNLTASLEPLSEVYMSPRTGYNSGGAARSSIFYGLILFSSLILLTSCVNFANLSLSQVQQRSREIGVRKAIGASRAQIVVQFLFESLILTLIALLFVLPIVYVALPVYTNLTDTAFVFSDAWQSSRLPWLIAAVLLTGILSGIFPAWALSRFEAASMVKNANRQSKAGRIFRSALSVFQFSLSTTLVLLAVGITLQVQHLNSMPIGFNRQNLVILDKQWTPADFRAERESVIESSEVLINELRQHPGISGIGEIDTVPPSTGPFNPWSRPHWPEDRTHLTSHIGVDENYLETMELELLAGRGFSREFPSDFLGLNADGEQIFGAMITRAALDNFELGSAQEALGEIIQIGELQFRIVGVVEDFRLSGGVEDQDRSVLVLRGSGRPEPALLMRIDSNQIESVTEHIDRVWAELNPGVPVNRFFFEESFDQIIAERTNGVNQAAMFAAIITIAIAVFGLYALALSASQSRTKEIGIRKTLGASSQSIIGLLVWDFIKPVLIACVVSWVCGYFAISYFFAQFSSYPAISVFVYLIVSLVTIAIAVLTVGARCWRAATINPVESLRYE